MAFKRMGIWQASSQSALEQQRVEQAAIEEAERKQLRQERIEARQQWTKAATDYGANGEGIQRATGWTNRLLGNPAGKRDDWPVEKQQEVALSEHFASEKIKELPHTLDHSQTEKNITIAKTTRAGVYEAQDALKDPESPGFWALLFGSQAKNSEPEPPLQPEAKSLPENPQEGFWSRMLGTDLWGNW